jgi:F0F1-type ATP synthase assembly protein I
MATPNNTTTTTSTTTTLFGTERELHNKSAVPTLGSFLRRVGPAADVRELEYISALHQNAAPFLRDDGTICCELELRYDGLFGFVWFGNADSMSSPPSPSSSLVAKDIAPYLSSRYGMEITPQQAVDIAVNLCGAKVRSPLSAEKDALVHAEEIMMEERNNDNNDDDGVLQEKEKDNEDESDRNKDPKEKDENEEKEKEEKHEKDAEEVYYFDLVQVMSLLLIGELVELADRNLGTEPGGLLELVLQSLTEGVVEPPMQHELIHGQQSFTKETLASVLEAFGDMDAAHNPELLGQMLQALSQGDDNDGDEDAPFKLTAESFLRALTDDVRSYSSRSRPTPKISSSKSTPTTRPKKEEAEDEAMLLQTSTFYDVFGRNWEENDDNFSSETNNGSSLVMDDRMGNAPQPKETASFIDYAADTYGSVVLNTAVWSLFLMTSKSRRTLVVCAQTYR